MTEIRGFLAIDRDNICLSPSLSAMLNILSARRRGRDLALAGPHWRRGQRAKTRMRFTHINRVRRTIRDTDRPDFRPAPGSVRHPRGTTRRLRIHNIYTAHRSAASLPRSHRNTQSIFCALQYVDLRILQPRKRGTKKDSMEISTMLTKTKAALAAALIVGAASAAQAGGNSGEYDGGFVMPGSTVGVNPVYHPGWFPGYAAEHRKGGESFGYSAPRSNAGDAFGYAPPRSKTARPAAHAPRQQDDYGPEAGKE
jgi:hypothetical protein